MGSKDTGRTLETTKLSLELLERIVELDGASLTELTEVTDLAKSTVYNHLTTLSEHGYVVNESNQYYLGVKFCHLGQYVKNQKSIYRLAEDAVSRLADEAELDADFAVEEHGRIVSLYGDLTADTTSHFLTDGRSFYVHNTASGRAIIAEYSDEHVHTIIDRWGLPQETEQSTTTREELFAELATVRERGYAISHEESIPGLWSISMAATEPPGDVCGALSLSCPIYLVDHRMESTLVEILQRHVERFEEEIEQTYTAERSTNSHTDSQ